MPENIVISPNAAARREKIAGVLESQVQACDNVMGDLYDWLQADPDRAHRPETIANLIVLARTSAQLAGMMARIEPLDDEKRGSIPQQS